MQKSSGGKKEQRRDLPQPQDDHGWIEGDRQDPGKPTPTRWAAVKPPEPIGASQYQQKVKQKPQAPANGKIQQAEWHGYGKRPRWVPHHDRLVGLQASLLLDLLG